MNCGVVVFGLLVASVVTTTPPKCCMPNEWMANLSDMVTITKGELITNEYVYSYNLKKIALAGFEFAPFKRRERVVYDYKKKKMFVITPDGSCKSYPNTDLMNPPCIPDSAVYLGSNYLGFHNTKLPYHGWKFQYLDKPKANITIAFTREGCVPIVEGVSGIFNGVKVEGTYLFSGYLPRVKDKSVFKVPPGC